MEELGWKVSWEVITGNPDFYQCTKGFHNGLQGQRTQLAEELLRAYEEINRRQAEELRPVLAGGAAGIQI